MKRIVTAAVVGLGLAFAAGDALADGELHIFNWGDYTNPDVIKKFEQAYNVKVTLDSYDSNDQMIAKIKAGGSGYDIVVPSSYVIPSMVKDGLLAPTEPDQMENFKNMRPEFVHVYWDDGRHYTVPWQWGTTGISVNTDLYKGPADSWALLFNPPDELKGKINVVPEMGDVMNAVSFYLGLPVCSDKKEDLQKINDTLIAAKPFWRTMDYGTLEKLTGKDVAVSMNWNGYSMRARMQVPAVKYVYPKEGIASWMDNVAVVKDAPNMENAKKFENFIMDPQNAAGLSAFARYDNGIANSQQYMPDDMKGAPEIAPPAGFKPYFVPACSQEVAEIYSKIWNNLLK
ncbi:MAG TPA: extracellular solute-binding protein [Dongiaceae bacterium]|jgi:spermidine/putrescine transport system substrate-binding protein